MTPIETRAGCVAIFEDNGTFRFHLVDLVRFCRHDVVIEGITRDQSIGEIESRSKRLGKIFLDAVLLDGNLDGGDTNEDGRDIAAAIREQPGGDKVFIVSTASEGLIEEADAHVSKRIHDAGFSAVRLVDEHIKAKFQQA
jgi:hypothetical protein